MNDQGVIKSFQNEYTYWTRANVSEGLRKPFKESHVDEYKETRKEVYMGYLEAVAGRLFDLAKHMAPPVPVNQAPEIVQALSKDNELTEDYLDPKGIKSDDELMRRTGNFEEMDVPQSQFTEKVNQSKSLMKSNGREETAHGSDSIVMEATGSKTSATGKVSKKIFSQFDDLKEIEERISKEMGVLKKGGMLDLLQFRSRTKSDFEEETNVYSSIPSNKTTKMKTKVFDGRTKDTHDIEA